MAIIARVRGVSLEAGTIRYELEAHDRAGAWIDVPFDHAAAGAGDLAVFAEVALQVFDGEDAYYEARAATTVAKGQAG